MQTKLRGNSLRKSERLYEKKAIDSVFEDGRSFVASPIRMLWLVTRNTKPQIKAGFSVPGRNFKRAVDRNLLKRKMREAYRKNKAELYRVAGDTQSECLIMFIYVGKTKALYGEIESKIVVTLQHLIRSISNEKSAGVNG